MIKLALVSPTENKTSETFIRQHRERLDGEMHYMYGGLLPIYVNNGINLISQNLFDRISSIVCGRLKNPKFSEKEIAFSKYLTANKIDVVLAEYGQTGATVLNVCKYLKLPLIVHFHGHDAYNNDLLSRYGIRFKSLFSYATTVISVSNDMTDKLVLLGCPVNKIIYNPCAPIETFYSINKTFDNKYFLSVGRFVEKKAPHITINAFRKTLEKHPDAHLIMIGDGELLEGCKNIVKDYGIENHVHFKGELSHDNILKYFECCFAYVQHSITANTGDSEGTPVSLLEAGAAGMPVVATRHAGIKDVVIDGVTGYLVNEKDVETMSEYMIKLASDKRLAAKLGKAARERISNEFNISKHISILNKAIVGAKNIKYL